MSSLPRRLAAGLLAALALLGAALSASAKGEPGVPDLRRRLLEAHTPEDVGRALDALQARVGQDPALPSLAALGDLLGSLPDGRDKHPLVLERRGWAYVSAKRGADAIPVLKAALEQAPSRGFVRAYLGEAERQAGDPAAALATLATAVRAGYDAPHLRESALQAVLALRKDQPAGGAAGLPAYAEAAAPLLTLVYDEPLLLTLAQALLDDVAAFEKPSSARGASWALAAGQHAQRLLERSTAVEGGARLARDAARALEPLDAERQGRTPRVDLLTQAYLRGRPADREGHDVPEVLPLLAEALLAEGRYAAAHRLARERLALSESPAARRVLLALPPDVGD